MPQINNSTKIYNFSLENLQISHTLTLTKLTTIDKEKEWCESFSEQNQYPKTYCQTRIRIRCKYNWVSAIELIYIYFFLKGKKVALHGNKSCKLRALKDGLLLALDLEIPNLEIEMDSFIAVKSLNSTTIPNAFLSSIVDDCRYLPERFEATTSNIFIGNKRLC